MSAQKGAHPLMDLGYRVSLAEELYFSMPNETCALLLTPHHEPREQRHYHNNSRPCTEAAASTSERRL